VFAEEREKNRERKRREREERGREEKEIKERTYGTRSSVEDYWILLSKVSFIYLNN
jgi:hypothetical protein